MESITPELIFLSFPFKENNKDNTYTYVYIFYISVVEGIKARTVFLFVIVVICDECTPVCSIFTSIVQTYFQSYASVILII